MPVSPQAETASPCPKTAMLLAAGLGARLRPLTQNLPKPLVQAGGKTLLERGLELLAAAGVEKTVINCHYLAEKMRAFVSGLAARCPMELILTDESAKLLDSAGAIIKALPLLGQKPFFVLNADTFWQETADTEPEFCRLARAFAPQRQDMLLLTVARSRALTPQRGDFLQKRNGGLRRADKSENSRRTVIYAGGLIINPAIFAGAAKNTPQSLNLYFDRAIAQKRLFGQNLRSEWFSIGTAAELRQAEILLQKQTDEV